MSVTWTVLTVAFLLVAVIVHEAAHALALRRLGFPIVEAGLGLPFPPRLVLAPNWVVPFRLSLSPWLLGAYVEPDPARQKEIEALPYRDIAWYSGAGVVANFLLAGVLGCILAGMGGHWVIAGLVAVGTGVLWFTRRLVVAFALPALGLPMLVALAYLLVGSVGEPQGVVGLGAALAASGLREAIVIGFALTVALGAVNLIPIYPFDGGRIVDAAIGRLLGTRPAAWFRAGTGIVAGCFVVYAVLSDVVWLLA